MGSEQVTRPKSCKLYNDDDDDDDDDDGDGYMQQEGVKLPFEKKKLNFHLIYY